VKSEHQNIIKENDPLLTGQRYIYIKEITTEKGLEEIKILWDDLLMKSHTNVLYLTYEWLQTWWRCFQSPLKKICVLAVYNGGELVGIAPFMEIQTKVLGFSINTIEFLSMVQFAYSPLNISATLDIIAKKEEHQNVIKSILEYLSEKKMGWHYIRLHPIPRKSPTLECMKNECRMIGLHYSQRHVLSNAVLSMETSWDEYLKERGKDFIKKFRHLKNKIAVFSDTGFKVYKDLKEFSFDNILTIERNSWKSKSGVPIDAKVYRNFYNEIMIATSLKGWLSLWVLSVDSTDIAYDLSIDYNKTVEALKSSYRSDYLDYSPGNLLTYFEIEEYFRRKIKNMNFLWGDHSFKTKWTSDLIPHDEVFIFNKTLISRCLCFIYHRLLFYRAYRYLFMSLEPVHCRVKRILNIL
jgi:CelD/BcsL family acetyltransferase involved in cellulose biosynthesis